jgi:hypothetical protein
VARSIPEEDLAAILSLIARYPDGASQAEISAELPAQFAPRTLQFRLNHLTAAGRLAKTGEGRATRYRLPQPGQIASIPSTHSDAARFDLPLSPASQAIRNYLSQPLTARKPVGYNRDFLDSYRPNETFYLTAGERTRLAGIGQPGIAAAAGTYARQILNRLLIDLAWNSSRLEGNTYSLLDTKRLIEFGEQSEGHNSLEAQMIVNHKDAIEFLVGSAEDIGFNRYTILNLHGILAQNLLPDQGAPGRLRRIAVGIEKSAFHPLEVPQLIEECFQQLLATADAIRDPFEQALFIMVQLPYLQPFDDVNKRVSRLAANIPFIQRNLSPLSFTEVPQSLYTEAILGVYELNQVDLLKDMFLWAYERSALHYAAVRQSLGEPDPFRFKHSAALRQVVAEIVRSHLTRGAAYQHLAYWSQEHIAEDERDRFRAMAENELLNLHEGNFARYQIRPSEFAAWQKIWGPRP